MMDITIGRYYPGKSVIHKMDARVKFFISIALMIVLFFLSKPIPFLVFGVFITIMIFLTKVPLKQIFLSLKPILFIIVFAFVLNLFSFQGTPIWSVGRFAITFEGLFAGLRMAVRLSLLIVTSSVFLTLTTTPLNVADAMESIMSPLQKVGFPAHEISMMMSIALRFVPNLMEETDKIMKAQSSRGAQYDTGGMIARARGLVSILVPLFVSCFRRAEELAVAMEARCYNGAEGRTKLNVMKTVRSDYIAIAFCSIFIAVIIVLEVIGK
jgi:energy-coupling factor transport system permease protein